jgi:hypothetical protein
MKEGLELIETKIPKSQGLGPDWPPATIKPIRAAQRVKLFGAFSYVPAPTASNPEGIKIRGSWQRDNLTRVTIPQLKGVRGAPRSGRIFFHKAAAQQLKDLFQAWEGEGLIELVKTWGGSWNPRFIRGSRKTLSNHAWSSAFDINVPWNMLGRQPALVGRTGSVRELVPLAAEYGFYWGGWGWGQGRNARPDGMHFECAKIL